jgi:hypothetical protein
MCCFHLQGAKRKPSVENVVWIYGDGSRMSKEVNWSKKGEIFFQNLSNCTVSHPR